MVHFPYKINKPKLIRTICLFLSIVILFFSTNQALAQWYAPTPEEHAEALMQCESGNVGLECTVQAITTGIINATNFGIAGNPNDELGDVGYKPGAILVAQNLITTLIGNPPVTGGQYAEYMAKKLNLVDQAYAQGGTGFQALNDFTQVWTAFRNIAYLAYVLIFLFVGFMIMFRAKLDPQTVVNIQNALPNLVITLILITFSYAIAGFMVDLIYIGIYLIIFTFASQGLIGNEGDAIDNMLYDNIFELFNTGMVFRLSESLGGVIQDLITEALQVNAAIEAIAGWLGQSWAAVAIGIAILFSMFRLLFQMILAYIQIIILTIFSPILILFNALPGSQSFGNWIRNFLSNILIFPTVATLILISAILIGPCENCRDDLYQDWEIRAPGVTGDNQAWIPPFIGIQTNADGIKAIIGIGITLIIPQLVASIQQSFKAKPLPISGVFAPIMAGSRIATAAPRAAYGAGSSMVKTYVGQKVEAAAGEISRR